MSKHVGEGSSAAVACPDHSTCMHELEITSHLVRDHGVLFGFMLHCQILALLMMECVNFFLVLLRPCTQPCGTEMSCQLRREGGRVWSVP